MQAFEVRPMAEKPIFETTHELQSPLFALSWMDVFDALYASVCATAHQKHHRH
jgi:hypothetical protein